MGSTALIISGSRKRAAVLAAAVVMLALLVALSAARVGAEQGGVSASAEGQAKITITISDGTSDFGTNLDPTCPASNSTDTVDGLAGSSGNQGCYYAWKSGGSGMTVTVKSNKTWNGTVLASENTGTSASITVASGALRWTATAPASYSECASATAFGATAQSWQSSVGKGTNSYAYYYCLRVDWNDDPGTFSSSATYEVTQA
ncbi:MAG: hypothetical protein HY683_02025 [Chloroflexi bacterium]|nr:hypothetical protein [Chloroflexota bacterium]